MSEHDDIAANEIAAKDALLEATLPNVLFDGWSTVAIDAAAASIGLGAGRAEELFPGGAHDLRNWLDDWADRRMVAGYQASEAASLRTHQRVAACIQERLKILTPYREAVRLALAARFNPTGATEAARAVYRTVDAIWYTIGDASTDFSFYTKRGILSGVYTASMLYWLNDRSEDAADTRDFIERRLAAIGNAPSVATRVRSALRSVGAPFEVLKRDLRR